MRLMANIKARVKTGLYEYRRVVPERLRDHLPPVVGFSEKPGRIEFTKSLGTRIVREARRPSSRSVWICCDRCSRRRVVCVSSGLRFPILTTGPNCHCDNWL